MKYKVGDKVLLYTWNELISIFGLIKHTNSINFPNHWYTWSSLEDSKLPKNRIVTIEHFDSSGDPCYTSESFEWFFIEIIKCHVNEYYLQQIKEEL